MTDRGGWSPVEYTGWGRKPKRQQGFQEKVLRKLDHIEKQLRRLMTDVTEVTQALENLKADLDAKAAEVTAEFEKLETELKEAGTPVDLEPLKTAIEGIDGTVKGIEVPTG